MKPFSAARAVSTGKKVFSVMSAMFLKILQSLKHHWKIRPIDRNLSLSSTCANAEKSGI